MKQRFSIWLFFLVVLLLPASIYAVVDWYQSNKSGLPILGEPQIENGKKTDHTIAPFEFTNQENKRVSIDKWKGKIVVADFFFTHCPSICPKMTASLKKVQAAYAGDSTILLSSFTVDPERDSAAQLQHYVQRHSIPTEHWDFLTGDKKELYKLARKSFLIVATDGDGGPEDFIHSDKLILIDPQQRIRGYYSGTEAADVEQLIKNIAKLKKEYDR